MRSAVLALSISAGLLALTLLPPLPQNPAYHEMADTRTLAGVPNALNVLSNLPFAIIGVLGLVETFYVRRSAFPSRWERWPAAALFAGIGLTAFGSAYYHLAPDNERLVWDRLPMALGFMGLLTWVVSERVDAGLARAAFVPLLAAGIGSVVYWAYTESRGVGDLRPYLAVQFGTLSAVTLLVATRKSRCGGSIHLIAALAAYGAAKVLEVADQQVYQIGGIVSGHTLKHLAAAAGTAALVQMIRARQTPVNSPATGGRVVYTRG